MPSTVGDALDEHLFEVLPGRFVRIVPFACRLVGESDVVLSHEHLETRWLPLDELGETIAGHRLPAGYLAAIRSGSTGWLGVASPTATAPQQPASFPPHPLPHRRHIRHGRLCPEERTHRPRVPKPTITSPAHNHTPLPAIFQAIDQPRSPSARVV